MFFTKNKIDRNLAYFLTNSQLKKFRVLIYCKAFKDTIIKKINTYRGTLLYNLKYSNLICALVDRKAIQYLIEYPEISYITFDEYLFLCGGMSISSANSCFFSRNNIHELSGKDVSIGLIDSGVYPHEDLISPSNRILEFTDLINNYKYPYDDNGHGTCCAGIICGSGISSNNIYSGIAKYSNILSYKCFDKFGKGYASTILFALESLIEHSQEKKLKILSLPFELLNYNSVIIEAFDKTFKKAISKNITPIVPTGSNINDQETIRGIAYLKSCITVGGLDTSKGRIPYMYSSSGFNCKNTKPDLCAACVNITSLNSNTSYISEKNGVKLYPKKLDQKHITFSGTSIAVAFVSGICALLYEKNPNYSFDDIKSLLKLNCIDEGFDITKQGEGTIDISRILK